MKPHEPVGLWKLPTETQTEAVKARTVVVSVNLDGFIVARHVDGRTVQGLSPFLAIKALGIE